MRLMQVSAAAASAALLMATWVHAASAAEPALLPAAEPRTTGNPVLAPAMSAAVPPSAAAEPPPSGTPGVAQPGAARPGEGANTAPEQALDARLLCELPLSTAGDAQPIARETPPRIALLPKLQPEVGAGQRRAGFIVLGASFFAFAGAGAMALSVAGNRENDLLYCAGDPNCTDSLGLLARSRARDGALAGYLLLGTGVAMVATGVVLLLTAPSKRASASAWLQSAGAPLLRF
jgi:hypothetical protein